MVNHRILQFIPEKLKNDQDFLLDLVKEDPSVFDYLPNDLKDDREFMRKAIGKNVDSFQYASDRLKEDKSFIKGILGISLDLSTPERKALFKSKFKSEKEKETGAKNP